MNWMCTPKIHVEILTPSVIVLGCRAFGRWFGVLRNVISGLKKRTQRAFSFFLCYIQWEDSHLWTRKWVFTRHQTCWHLSWTSHPVHFPFTFVYGFDLPPVFFKLSHVLTHSEIDNKGYKNVFILGWRWPVLGPDYPRPKDWEDW